VSQRFRSSVAAVVTVFALALALTGQAGAQAPPPTTTQRRPESFRQAM